MNIDASTIRVEIPLIPNASPLYAKIASMQIGEVLDVEKWELPKSYYSPKKITAYISKRYNMLFYVNRLTAPYGWRIYCVTNVAEQKQLNPLKQKKKAMENNVPLRNHNLTDAELSQLVDEKILFARADLPQVAPRGVTAARLDALQVANDAFKLLPSDAFAESRVGIKIEERNAAQDLLQNKIGNLRTMVQNVFGDKSASYRGYKFEGMVSLNAKDLVALAGSMPELIALDQAALTTEGCDAAFVASFTAAVTDLDQKRDQVAVAERNRYKATETRNLTSNSVYTELDKICNTCKDVYRETDPVKYNSYLIYPSSGGGTPATTIVNFTIPMGGYTVLLNQPYNGDLQFEVKNNSSASCKLFLSVDGLTPFGITIPVPPNSTVTKKYTDLSASGSYLILANENMMQPVSGVFTYPV